MIVYQVYTKRQYQRVKNSTDYLGVGFLPTWKKQKKRETKVLPKISNVLIHKQEQLLNQHWIIT